MEEKGGHHHGLDNIMDDRNRYSLFGSLLPSLVPKLAKPISQFRGVIIKTNY